MRTLFLLLGLLISVPTFAQLRDCDIHTRYVEFYEWNVELDEYEKIEKFWHPIDYEVRAAYCAVKLGEDDEFSINFWEFAAEDEDGDFIYFTEDGRKYVFSPKFETIAVFSKWDEQLERYLKIVVCSRISVNNL